MYDGHLAHPYQRRVYKSIDRPNADAIRVIASTYTGFVVDRIGKHGVMDPAIKPLSSETVICGPAITVLGPDLTLRRVAADLACSGDIIVIAAGGASYACFGDGTARKMKLAGVQGVVIDGFTRDARRVAALRFGCFCRGSTLANYDYPVFPQLGAINVPVSCGNAIVYPGDLIFGDADGVLVIPRKFVDELAVGLQHDLMVETQDRLALKKGYKFNELGQLVERGYDVVDGPFSVDE